MAQRTHAISCLLFLSLPFLAKSQQLGDLRLIQGNPGISNRSFTSGLLQVYLSNEWGEICADGFGQNEADVACHQLGFSGAVNVSPGDRTSTNPLLNQVECPFNDYLHLLRCVHSVRSVQCNSSVMLTCNSTPIWNNPYSGELRLSRGTYPSEGLVEVYCNGQWGTICDDGFGQTEADTVCRQLGYTEAERYDHLTSIQGTVFQLIWLEDVICSSGQSCIQSCQQCPSSQFSRCRHSDDVTIQCKFTPFYYKFGSNQTTCENVTNVGPRQGDVRLVQVQDSQDGIQSGAVEVHYNMEWRRVCDPKSSSAALATTVCRQLGYNRFVNNSILPYNISVSRLLFTSNSTHWHVLRSDLVTLTTDCDDSFAVHCDDSGTNYKGQVRLRGGQYSSTGRVEVFLENQWGTVCTSVLLNRKRQVDVGRDTFVMRTAHSVCRQLGYTRAVAYYQGIVPGSDPTWIANPSCTASYDCFRRCYRSYYNLTICSHNQDLFVNCTYDAAESSRSVGNAEECLETRLISPPPQPYTPFPTTRPPPVERPVDGLDGGRIAGIVVGSIVAVVVLIGIIIAIVVVSVIVTRCGKKGHHGSRMSSTTRPEDTVYFTPQSTPSAGTSEPEKPPIPT